MLSRPLNIKTVTIGEVLQGLLLKLDKKGNIEKDMAILIAKAVLNKLNSGNMRECVRIARLAGNNVSNYFISTFLLLSNDVSG